MWLPGWSSSHVLQGSGATVSLEPWEEASHGPQRHFVPILVCDPCRVIQNALL